jgi:hypothetical protein
MSSILERIQDALSACPSLVAAIDQVQNHPGHTLKEFEILGISKKDLIWMERRGLAVRGRRVTKDGPHVNAWVLLAPPKEEDDGKSEGV